MGELAFKFGSHYFHIAANETLGVIDGTEVSLLKSWTLGLDDKYTVTNTVQEGGRMYEIAVENSDVNAKFIRKLYAVSGLADQWHFDYKAKLLSAATNLHGLLGQTWEEKHFADKAGAFQFLDGEEENYRIKSNDIFGDDFGFNKFNNK